VISVVYFSDFCSNRCLKEVVVEFVNFIAIVKQLYLVPALIYTAIE
jgi:hypothetical protein